MNHELRKRLNNFPKGGLDSILVTNFRIPNPNFFYFTNSNFFGAFFHNFKTNKSAIFTVDMKYEKAKKFWVKNIIRIEKAEDLFSHTKGKTVGIDKNHITARSFEKIKYGLKKKSKKIIDISKNLENARAKKTGYEIKCITKACRITNRIFRKIEPEIEEGITEKELSSLIEFQMTKFNVTPSFPTIVASGNNIRIPHHETSNTKLRRPVLIDLGVNYRGYNSDMTRTYSSRYEETIENIFNELESKIEPGIKTEKIDKLSRTLLGKNAKHFITSLGHGIGIETHERPGISKNSRDIFQENNTFALEPGIYVKNGIRIERDYLLTKKRLKSLSGF